MTIKIGEKFPKATLTFYELGSIKTIDTQDMCINKRIVLFGMPGAFTPTCSQYHIPSIINQIKNYKEKGIDDVICIVVNDVYVASVWSKHTGATKAGLKIVSDPCGNLIKEIGMSFSSEKIGFLNRSLRFCLIINNGIVKKIFKETETGKCNITCGSTILSQI